jgi:hypothetical protein
MPSRRAYFKSLPTVDADQNASLTSLASSVQQLQINVEAASTTATNAFTVATTAKSGATQALQAAQSAEADAAQASAAVEGVQAAITAAQSAADGAATAVTTLSNAADARITAENAFFTAFRDGVFLESTAGSNAEYDYTALGLAAPDAGQVMPQ